MTGTSCLGPLAGLQAQKELYAKALTSLSNSITTTVFLVSRPEHSSLTEAERTRSELEAIGIKNQKLILNGVFHASGREDSLALALESRGRKALAEMPQGLRLLPQEEVALIPNALIGVKALRELTLGHPYVTQAGTSVAPTAPVPTALLRPPLADHRF